MEQDHTDVGKIIPIHKKNHFYVNAKQKSRISQVGLIERAAIQEYLEKINLLESQLINTEKIIRSKHLDDSLNFLDDLYQKILHRKPQTIEIIHYAAILDNETLTFDEVKKQLEECDEAKQILLMSKSEKDLLLNSTKTESTTQYDETNENKLSYFQKTNSIQGPAMARDFDNITLISKRNAIEDFVINHSNSNTKVLDAGCNVGVEGYRLYQKGFSGVYTGIDSNLKALYYALDNLESTPATFSLSDISETNFSNDYFDITFTMGVLEGLEYYESALDELSRITSQWLIIAPYVDMTDEPDLIQKHPQVGVFANRYNRQKLYDYLEKLNFEKPKVIFRENDPTNPVKNAVHEVIVFKSHKS